jgi:hypothetical protein
MIAHARILALSVAALAALLVATGAHAGQAQPAPLNRAPFDEAQGRERAGPRDPRFDDAFDRAMLGLRPTPDPLGIDDLILLKGLRALVARGVEPASSTQDLRGRGRRALPSGAFASAHDMLARAFAAKLDVDAETAAGLAAEIEAQALKAAGVGRAAYLRVLAAARPAAVARAQAARTALAVTWRASRIDRAFEVPYVAGYDRDDGAYVFIDCAIPMELRRAGRILPVGRLLTLHERVEKALLTEFGLVYPSAHQIALRIEKAAARAISAPWRPYDDYITRISTQIAARKTAHTSDRLDLTPYYTWEDAENLALVRRIESGKIAHTERADAKPGPVQPIAALCPASGLAR